LIDYRGTMFRKMEQVLLCHGKQQFEFQMKEEIPKISFLKKSKAQTVTI
jgi:hypothetical protein